MVAAVSNAIGASNVAFRKSLDSISSVVCSSCHLFVYRGSLQIEVFFFFFFFERQWNGIYSDIYSSQIGLTKSDGDISLQISLLRQE